MDKRQAIYRSLYLIRRVEEEIARIYPSDKIKSPVHLSIGQESVAVGVCEALRPDDIVFGTYRSHALYLAHGGDLKKMMAELYGKQTGCAKGKGGSMHLIDVANGVMGASAVVGTTIANAAGYAYAMKYRRSGSVVVSFFGDGAVDEGVFHETMNFASLKKLPMIFVCENNSYAIYTHQRERQSNPLIAERAQGYGISAQRIDNGDVMEIQSRVSAAVSSIVSGDDGPCFFECMTCRWKEHVGVSEDYHHGFRTPEETEPWRNNDQVAVIASTIDSANRDRIEQDVEAQIAEAIAFAEDSPFPENHELYTGVFK